MSEMNLMEQLKAAANEPDQTLEEYKSERSSNQNTKYDDRPRPYEKELEADVITEEKNEPGDSAEKDYKPWEKETEVKPEEDEDDDVIVTDSEKKVPLQKLLKLKAQKKEREAELDRYKAQLAEYETVIKRNLPKEEAEVIVDPIEQKLKSLKEPDPNLFNDWDSYKAADNEYKAKIREIEEERIIARVEKGFKEKQLAEAQKAESDKRTEAFINKIEEASKTNPDIKHAVAWFEKTMIEKGGYQSINPNVQQALVHDDNAPELIHRVVKDKDLMDAIFSKNDTVGVLKKIGKIAAYIELEKDTDDEVTYKPGTKKSVPRTLSGNSGGNQKTSDKADDVLEYKRLRAKEAEMERKNRRR